MSTSTWLASDSVEAICAQLDPMMMAAVGCCMSFSDHESVQWIAPVAENLKHHSCPFIDLLRIRFLAIRNTLR